MIAGDLPSGVKAGGVGCHDYGLSPKKFSPLKCICVTL